MVSKQVERAGKKQMSINLPPGPPGHHRHAPENSLQQGELRYEQNIVIPVEEDLVRQDVFVGINQEHVDVDPPQQKNQKIQRAKMEFLFLLSRTRPQRRGAHHRNRFHKKRDVPPQRSSRTPPPNTLADNPSA